MSKKENSVFRNIVGMAVATGFCISGFSTTAGAESITNYPGTKARGMGSAFVAVADDASAAWYNPAGLTESGVSNLMLEIGNTISITKDSDEGFEDDKITGFVSVAWVSDKYAISLFYHNPYRPAFYASNWWINGRRVYGFVDQTIHIYGLGASYDIIEESGTGVLKKVSVGVTGEWVQVNGEDSEMTTYSGYRVDTSDFDKSSLSGSVGVLTTLYQSMTQGVAGDVDTLDWKINLGATYRHESDTDFTTTTEDDFDTELSQNKPMSWDVGVAFIKEMDFMASRLTASLQYGETDYSTMNDYFDFSYEKWAIGLEYQINGSWSILEQVAVRAGYNTAEMDKKPAGYSLYPHESSSLTAGFSLGFSGGVNLDFSYENRSWEFGRRYSSRDEDFDLTQVALRWAFGDMFY